MSVRTDVVNLNINVNGNKAQNELNTLRKKAADVKFEMDGLKKGTAEYIAKSKELAQVNAQMSALKKEIGITALTQKELISELNKLKSLRGSVIPFSNEYKELSKSIKQVENRLYDVRNGVQGFASVFSKVKDEVKQFGLLAVSYLGFQFLTSQFTNIIRGAGKLSDQLADLQRVAGLTAGEAKNLNSQFKELDTRTSTGGLRDIAIIAGKLGVAKDDIFEFTKAVDQLVVALGDELGNADAITETLGKILNVFDGKVTGDNITSLGNAFVELANSGVASAGFIADFVQRLSGIAKSANIGLGELSGLGAGLEELGARVESSSTAIQKLVVSIASDIPAAAKIAGLSTKEFNDLFAKNATEALLKYSEGLVKNKQSFSEVTASLKDAGEEGARTIETITKLGTNADLLRGRIKLGADALKENGAITEAFALKNETLGATIDKLGKEFNRLVTSPALTNFLKGAVEGALAFVKAIRGIPSFIEQNKVALLTLAAGLLFLNKQYVFSALATINDTVAKAANVVVTRTSAIVTQLVISAQAAYITVTNLLAGRIGLATAAQRLWNIATTAAKVSILGLVLTAGSLIVVLSNLIFKQKEMNAAQRAAADIATRLQEITADEEARVKSIFNSLRLGNLEYKDKVKLLEELKSISPGYLNTLTLENIKTQEGLDILNNYLDKLRETNRVKARNEVILDKEKRVSVLETEQKNLQGKGDIKGNFFEDIGAQLGLGSGSSGFKFVENTKELKNLKDELTSLYADVGTGIKKAVTDTVSGNDELAKAGIKDSPGAKKGESEFDRLKKEAEKFYNDIQNLKKRIDKNDNPEEQEIQRATQKYEELLLKAKEYYLKKATSTGRFNEEEKIIEDEQRRELNEIFQKYFKKRLEEGDAKEYDDALTARHEFSNQLKVQAGKDYADGKIGKAAYSNAIKQIDKDETSDRIIIAEDYSKTVKKAAADVTAFRKKEEEQTTQDLIKESEARVAVSEAENSARLRRAVLTTRPGSSANLAARKAELKNEEELEVQATKDKYEALGILLEENNDIIQTIRADFNLRQEELDNEHTQRLIENVTKYTNYLLQALNSVNQLINNREAAQFNKEKALNNKKRKEFKSQLDNKLISQAQYDKKMNELQEEQDKKERELKRKQAKREKALNLFRAIVNTAAGVASSLSYGGPVGIALAAITAVLGALEIAAIASQPLPEAGRGKYFGEGDKHSDASGGIPIKVEKGEAVITAPAMDDDQQYVVRGTPKQITSALNSQAGGVSWAGGAIVKKISLISDRPSRINPNLPAALGNGGIVRDIAGNGANNNADTNALLQQLVNETKQNTSAIKELDKELHAVVSIKEYREKEKQYDAAQKLSGLG